LIGTISTMVLYLISSEAINTFVKSIINTIKMKSFFIIDLIPYSSLKS